MEGAVSELARFGAVEQDEAFLIDLSVQVDVPRAVGVGAVEAEVFDEFQALVADGFEFNGFFGISGCWRLVGFVFLRLGGVGIAEG